ncbi:MAG: aspartate/glutamate racemase family protein [Xylophilus ampelinus]
MSGPRLLVLNPNTSESVTALIEAQARRSMRPGTELTVRTAVAGVAYIETRFEALLGAHAAAEMAAASCAGHDAVIVAAFGDPGVAALREALPVPVVGLTDAALSTACLLGGRFSIIAISQRIQAWYREVVEDCGLGGRLASIRALDRPLSAIDGVQAEHGDALVALAEAAVREDGADVLVLAGAPLAGLARSVAPRLPVPAVDGVDCAVRQAELLAAMGVRRARSGSYAPPPAKPNRALSPAVARLLGQSGGAPAP